MTEQQNIPSYNKRRLLLYAVLLLVVVMLLWRAVYLQVLNKDFLQNQGDARHLRVVSESAHRGMIEDRNGEPLAISTPVDSIWVNPEELVVEQENIPRLAHALGVEVDKLQSMIASRMDREFVYVKRHVNPDLAKAIMDLEIPGVFKRREYRRYYPAGEVTAHVLGFTDIDDLGQEGLELAYNEWLQGTSGSKRVIKDRLGRIVENVESIRPSSPGKTLALSIDRRIQYLAYRELKAAVQQNKARSGTAVVLDVKTGEILAMVNQPSFNPNNRKHLRGQYYRNRAVTDVFEPGSTFKPFTIAAALESGKYTPKTLINTNPGYYKVGRNTIRDVHDYGVIDVTHVITKSSNVGASKIALSLDPERLWSIYNRMGFGSVSGSGFPGESPGLMSDFHRWRDIERATLSFGYGISVTALQLAHAYSVIAADGVKRPVSFLKLERKVEGERVLPAEVAQKVRRIMETVVSPEGTGMHASVQGYRIAGKTGTVHKSTSGGYAENRYLSVFGGIAPATRPRLVMVVMINEPAGEKYFGGQVAAPVFGRVMSGALRLLDVPPDNLQLTGKDKHKPEARS